MTDEIVGIKARSDQNRQLVLSSQGTEEYCEAASLSQAVLNDRIGGSHPVMAELSSALKAADYTRAVAASRAVVRLYDLGALKSPRLAIAREIGGDVLGLAEAQAQSAESMPVGEQGRLLHLAIAAFLLFPVYRYGRYSGNEKALEHLGSAGGCLRACR